MSRFVANAYPGMGIQSCIAVGGAGLALAKLNSVSDIGSAIGFNFAITINLTDMRSVIFFNRDGRDMFGLK